MVRNVFCFKGKCLRDSHPGCRKQNIQRLLFAPTFLNELSNCLSLERRTPLLFLIDHRQVHDAAIPRSFVNGLTRLAILEGGDNLLDVLNIFIHGSRRQGL